MYKYSPSVNIARDKDINFKYVTTANAQSVVNAIDGNFALGKHSFVIIGSYGTGKSSLLWAIEQTLSKRRKLFEFKSLPKRNVEFLNVVGSYQSVIDAFSEQLGIKNSLKGNQLILDRVHQIYEATGKDGLLVIQIDELGKFLEYAAGNNSKSDLYFLQQLAEVANNPNENILFITTLHQNFESYALGLSEVERNEWNKIRGRFEIIAFNEPVEQLLMLASEALPKSNIDKSDEIRINKISVLLKQHAIAPISSSYINSIKSKLFPLDPISATFLTLALQRYGQNDRSLFSFLNSNELQSFNRLDGKREILFDLVNLYDYLWVNFYNHLNSKSNQNFNTWNDIRDAIETIENENSGDREQLIALIKVIGLFQLFASKGSSINSTLLIGYLKSARNVDGIESLLKILQTRKLIRYSNYNRSFRVAQGTDLDIEAEIKLASDRVERITNVADSIQKHCESPTPVLAKRVSFEKGTPRLFNYEITEEPLDSMTSGEFDGTINLVLNSTIKLSDIGVSSKFTQNVIYAVFRSADKIKEQLFEIEKSLKVITEHGYDKAAVKELNQIVESHKKILLHYFVDGIFGKDVLWLWNGEVLKLRNKMELNSQLSIISEHLYPKAPIYRNELINRNKISTSISTARNELFRRVVSGESIVDLGFDDNFPPEKTIYITLLRESGIHRKEENGYAFGDPPRKSNFKALWDECQSFLEDCRDERLPLTELFERLKLEPFGLKRGIIETFVPIFLYIKRDDYALFGDDGYIPEITDVVMQMFIRNAKEYRIKSFNVSGVNLDLFKKYREFLNQSKEVKPTNKSFIESIRPFLVFYKQLPEYTRNTNRLTKEAKAIREAIIKAQDPEETFFLAFPKALNTSIKELNGSPKSLQVYTNILKEKITELRGAYDELLNRFERCVCHELGLKDQDFREYKSEIVERYKKVKPHLLLNYQKTFLQRVNTKLDDRNSWLSSIAQALIGKSLETIRDEDELNLFDKFKNIIHELDNMVELSSIKVNEEKERVYKFEITSEKLLQKRVIKIPKTKFIQSDKLEKEIRKTLATDKLVNLAVLTKLLQEQLKNE